MKITQTDDLFLHENLVQIIAFCIALNPTEQWNATATAANSITLESDTLRITIATNFN